MPPKRAKDQPAEYAYYPGKCRPIVDDLPPAEELRRIQDLAKYVREMKDTLPQNDRGDFCDLFAHVTRTDLLKRCGQKAETAVSLGCCIADLLRVFAPHPPTLEERRMLEVLLFMVRGLKALDYSGPIFEEALYLLENLTSMESLKLGLQIPGFQDILRKMIITSLNVFNSRDEVILGKPPEPHDGKHVQRLLLSLIQSLIVNADHISNEVLDALFFFIIEPQKSQSRVSYRMAAEIIKQSCTNIEPWCVPFLSQAILTQEMPECRMTGAKRLDSIVFSLYEIVPDTILTILPQMEGALTAGNPEHRLNATKLLGDIFKLPDVNAADRVPQLWTVFLERSKDVSKEVRKQCIEQLAAIFLEHQSVRGDISTALGRRVDDEIEEVRLAAVRSIFEILRSRMDLVTDVMLRQVRNHVHPREKKQSVRHECLLELSKIYHSMYTVSEPRKATASELATIADTVAGVFRYISMTIKEDRIALEKAFVLNIVAFKAPVQIRVSMLLDLFVNLRDEVSVKVLTTLFTMQARRLRVIRSMWEAVRAANEKSESGLSAGEEKDAESYKKEAETMIRQLADTELEPLVIVKGLQKFGAYIEKEPRVFNALQDILKGDYQCEDVEKNMLDIRRFLGGADIDMSDDEKRQVRSFLERSVPLQVDNKVAVELSQRLQRVVRATSCRENTALAQMKPYLTVWKMIAEYFPQCFLHDEVAMVISNLLENDDSVVLEHALCVIISASRVRNCQQYLLKAFPDHVIQRIIFIAKNGPPKAAKYAARCLCRILGRERTFQVFEDMREELISHVDAKDPLCETALQTLAVMLHAYTKEYANSTRDMINTVLMDRVIHAGTLSPDVESHDDDERDDAKGLEKPKEILPQIIAFKFLYRYHKALHALKDSTVKKSIGLWIKTLNTRGSCLSDEIKEEHSHILMFYAANYLLKMSQYEVYRDVVITPEVLCSLTPVIYDIPATFRNMFLQRFQPLISKNLVPVEFMALYAFAPLVKADQDYINTMTNSLRSSILTRSRFQNKSKSYKPTNSSEYSIAFAINAFALMPDWEDPEDLVHLKKLKKCLWMLLGAMNEKRDSCCNLILVRTILESIKMSECAWVPSKLKSANEKMWILADTALSLLYNRAKMTTAGTYREIVLSTQFFKHSDSLRKVARKSFAPKEILNDDAESLPSSTPRRAKRSKDGSRSLSPAQNGNSGTPRSKWLGHLISSEPGEDDEGSSPKGTTQNGNLRRSRRGKAAAESPEDEPGPSTSTSVATRSRRIKVEPTEPKRASRRVQAPVEHVETPVKRGRRGKIGQKELEPLAAPPTKPKGRAAKRSKEEEKPEEEQKRPTRATRTRSSTAAKKKEKEPESSAPEDEEEDSAPMDESSPGDVTSPGDNSDGKEDEPNVRASGRLRRKREIFDSSPAVSPTKQKEPMSKVRRVALENRFASISPITGTLATRGGPVSSTPMVKPGATKGRGRQPPKAAALPTRASQRKKN